MDKLNNILFTVGWPIGQGGHIQSLLNIISEIKQRDNKKNIYLIGPSGSKIEYFKNIGVNYIEIDNKGRFQLINLIRFSLKIFSLSVRNHIDVIHSMDYESLKPSIISNIFLKKVLIFTKAGGPPASKKLKYPFVSKLIVFSKELLDNFLITQKHLAKNTVLIKERIVVNKYSEIKNSSNKMVIAMRFDSQKKVMLDNLFFELQKLKIDEQIQLQLCGDGPLISNYKAIGKSIEKNNNKIKLSFMGEISSVEKLNDLYNKSFLIIGHGRGIMEAMALGKAVVLLHYDTKGSSLILKNNIENIAQYNFSGRKVNQKSLSLSETIEKHFSDDKFLKKIGIYNKKYIQDNYDITIGVDKLLNVYRHANYVNLNQRIRNISWVIKRFLF